MSFAALAWAGKCKPGSASRKLVLLALADRHNDECDGAYPSIAWLVEFTDLNRKTVINCLSELEGMGLISDSGERRGDTRQIKLYRLHLGTVPKTEQSQKRNSTDFSEKQSQKRDTDTVREPITQIATQSSSRERKRDEFPKPDWADAQVWADFMSNRKAKRMKNHATAYKRFLDDIARHSDAEWPPGRLLEHAAAHGWGGIYDPRPKDQRNGNHQQPECGQNLIDRGEEYLARLREGAEQDQDNDPGTGAPVSSEWSGRGRARRESRVAGGGLL